MVKPDPVRAGGGVREFYLDEANGKIVEGVVKLCVSEHRQVAEVVLQPAHLTLWTQHTHRKKKRKSGGRGKGESNQI